MVSRVEKLPESFSGWLTADLISQSICRSPDWENRWWHSRDPFFYFVDDQLQKLFQKHNFRIVTYVQSDYIYINDLKYKVNKLAAKMRLERSMHPSKTLLHWLDPFWIRLTRVTPSERFPGSYPIDTYRR